MHQAENVVEVGSDENTASILRRGEEVSHSARGGVRGPPDATTMRTLDDFNLLRDLQRHRKYILTVVSPEQTIIGLARIYGFEVKNTAPKGERRAVTLDVPEESTGTLPQFSSPRRPGTPDD